MANVGLRFHTYEFSDIIESWGSRMEFINDAAMVPKRPGQIIQDGKVGVRVYEMRGSFGGSAITTPTALRTARDAMLAVIAGRTANLYLLDDRFVECRLSRFMESFREGSGLTFLDFVLEFESTLPFEQSEALQTSSLVTTTSGNQTTTVTNAGNYDAFCRVKVTAPGGGINNDCTVTNVTRDESFQFLGNIAASDILVVDGMDVPFSVENDGVDAIEDFSGEVILLSPGSNTIRINSVIGATLTLEWRDTWV